MSEQEDPAQQERDRLAQGEETELPTADEASAGPGGGAQRESIETDPAESSRTATGSPDDASEASRRGMPGYQ
jgi:hypothetical protein